MPISEPLPAALRHATVLIAGLTVGALGCERREGARQAKATVTFPASAVGAEAEVLQAQLDRFMTLHPEVTVVPRRTPDAADQRHQLYVQWLNARATDPDVLQLDVIWTPEFAAAGWLLPLDRFSPPVDSFLPAGVEANRLDGALYALPWFVDIGMLYWRTDLMPRAPRTFAELLRTAAAARRETPMGFVWQGARYEGLVTVFLELVVGFGGAIVDSTGVIGVDSEEATRALAFLVDAIHRHQVSPMSVLTWQEEQSRFAFQTGRAAFMRNWPYAYALLQDPRDSDVAGRFAVAPMPSAPGGRPAAALGGSQLAINVHSDQPHAAYELIAFLTQPDQMLERARIAGQYPTWKSLYSGERLRGVLPVPPERARQLVESAVPRPVTPVYTELSGILQVWLHRALSRQVEPGAALRAAATEMRRLQDRFDIATPLIHEP